tara:strand:- start:42 stop:254 length:213 start_codon:yes stop_codon:yes gene_type:complete
MGVQQSPVRLYTPSENVVSRIMPRNLSKLPVRTLKIPIIAESTRNNTMLVRNIFCGFIEILFLLNLEPYE